MTNMRSGSKRYIIGWPEGQRSFFRVEGKAFKISMISGRCLHNGSKDRTKERWGKKFHGYQKPPGEIVDDYAKRFKIVMLWCYGGYM
jgi:hypothetical protein